jgi:hypothetical protein
MEVLVTIVGGLVLAIGAKYLANWKARKAVENMSKPK